MLIRTAINKITVVVRDKKHDKFAQTINKEAMFIKQALKK